MLTPVAYKVALEGYTLDADIGFHPHETGVPQRLVVDLEIWLDPAALPTADGQAHAWDYDFLRPAIARLAQDGRHDLQETLARRIFDLVAARPGVVGLKVRTAKPDIYPDCAAVAVELSSLPSVTPQAPTSARTAA
jgi:dihydroneopterin aldolase